MGAYKRYSEFGGKEQQADLQVREFREFGTASLRGIIVSHKSHIILQNISKFSRL